VVQKSSHHAFLFQLGVSKIDQQAQIETRFQINEQPNGYADNFF